MNLNTETIEKLISNTFEIDCIDITLTQEIDKDPIVYKGSGTIYQDKNGILQLKLYTKIQDLQKELQLNLKYHTPGKFISSDNYFILKAVDMSGKEWFSDNILVSGNVSLPASGRVIKSKLEEIELIEEGPRTGKNNLFIVVPGKYEIPCNEKEDLPNGGWRLNRSVFSANNIEFNLRNLENYLTINANSTPEYLGADEFLKIRESFSVITGLVIRPVVVENILQDSYVLKIMSVDNTYSNKKLAIPFRHSTSNDIQSFSSFMEKYLQAVGAPFSDLFGFWYKINRAWQAGVENSSLSLGVAIEGIIRSYFGGLGLPDEEIVQQANDARKVLSSTELGERIEKRLLGSIDELLKKQSPKGALYQLTQDGLIRKEMAGEWIKLRNKSVHPYKREDPLEAQKYINQIYTCIALFYCLLFVIIKYDWNYIDYSEFGWPEKKYQI